MLLRLGQATGDKSDNLVIQSNWVALKLQIPPFKSLVGTLAMGGTTTGSFLKHKLSPSNKVVKPAF